MKDPPRPRALTLLLALAAAVILVAGLRAAGQIVLPVLVSMFLAMLAAPIVRGMMRLRIPRAVAIALVMLVVTAILIGVSALLGDSLARFTARFPSYQAPLQARLDGLTLRLSALRLPTDTLDLNRLVDPDLLLQGVRVTVSATITLFSNLLIVVVTTAFILLETTALHAKLGIALGREAAEAFAGATANVVRYLAIKTGASLVTGLLAGLLCAVFGLDFALLWGIIAFLFNYIPTIGSIVAAVPAVALAAVLLPAGQVVLLALGYLAINISIGYFAEPRILGRRLGLSPLVVFLSLLFWGFVWGPAGMLLSVPVTVVFKLLLECSNQTRWLAVLLGPPVAPES